MATRKSPAPAEKKTAARKAPAKKAAAAPVESMAVDKAIAQRTPTYDEIAIRAEQFWNERGRPFGSPEVDWLRAEAILKAA